MFKVNNIKTISIFILLFVVSIAIKAESYNALWKKVEQSQQKDMPKTALKSIDRIIQLAEKEENGGQLMKALLVRWQLVGDIAPDSSQAMLPRLERMLSEERTPEMQSLYHLTLGLIYREQNSRLYEDAYKKAIAHFEASMAQPFKLADAKATDYIPLVIKGNDSQYFNQDLLHLVAPSCINGVKSLSYALPSADSIAMNIAQKEYEVYVQRGMKEAQFFTKLQALQILGIALPQKTKKDEHSYEQLIQEFGQLDVAVEAYIQLVNETEGKKSYDYCQEGIKRYPKSKRTAELRNRLNQLTQPEVSLSNLPKNGFPEQIDSISILSRNLKEATLFIYPTQLTAQSEELRRHHDLKEIKHGVPVVQMPLRLPQGQPYEQKQMKVAFRVPQAGIYLVELKSTEAKSGLELMYVSSLHLMQLPLPNGRTRLVVSNAHTGKPVQGAKIDLRSGNQNFQLLHSWETNQSGEVTVQLNQNQSGVLYVSTETDNYLQEVRLNRNSNYHNDPQSLIKSLALYTDRAIYRPGQIVKVGGFLFKKQGDETSVLTSENVTLRMLDANRKETDKQMVTTDKYGSIATEFKIPEHCLNGQFSITSTMGTAHFRVEEYKRPTFMVSFLEYKKAYQAGDTIQLQGEVKTYTGFPLSNTRVAVTVNRRSSAWYFFRRNANRQVFSDTLTTDEKGFFSIPIYLDINEPDLNETDFYRPRLYVYTAEAVATSENGESESAEYSLSVGNRSAYLTSSLPDLVCRERPVDFSIIQRNASGQLIEGTADCQVLKDGAIIQTLQLPFNETLSTNQLNTLQSGKYLIRMMPFGQKDSLVVLNKSLTFFSFSDKKPVGDDPLMVFQSDREFTSPSVRVLAGSPLNDVYLHCDLFGNDQLLESGVVAMSDSLLSYTYKYNKEYGNGLLALFSFVKEGKVHTASVTIKRPQPDKRLELKWKSFRDRLHPGDKETWTLQVLKNGKPVDASLMATLYDASLDKFSKLNWFFNLQFDRSLRFYSWRYSNLHKLSLFASKNLKFEDAQMWDFSHFDERLQPGRILYRKEGLRLRGLNKSEYKTMAMPMMSVGAQKASVNDFASVDQALQGRIAGLDVVSTSEEMDDGVESGSANIPIRSDFSETAFFQPQLVTNDKGEVELSFTLPQSLTQWNFQALAHTAALDYGMMDTTIVVSKDFMVQPNMPRFLRVGDRTRLSASIRNATNHHLSGKAILELVNPEDMTVISRQNLSFSVQPKLETTVDFPYQATAKYPVIICRFLAESGTFSDGEQYLLPILDDQQEIVESIPFSLMNKGTHQFDLSQLFEQNNSSVSHRRMTVEYTANPTWLAITALPSLTQPVSQNSVSMATAYYALSLATLEAHAHPEIEKLATSWRESGNVDSLFLLLERNQDLKQVLLNETPWVASADKERERLQELARLFDPLTLSYRRQGILDKLLALQNPDGSWSWFKGMDGSLWMTVDVFEMMSKFLQIQSLYGKVQETDDSNRLERSLQRAQNYMDKEVAEIVHDMKKWQKKTKHDPIIGNLLLRYLHICDLRRSKMTDDRSYLLNYLEQSATSYNMYAKSLTAGVLHSAGKEKAAMTTLKSLMEHTVYRPEMGRYFDTDRADSYWNSYRIPTQVAALDALHRLTPSDTVTIQEMKRWLLQAKRTQSWNSPLASVDAIYYLFLHPSSEISLSAPSTNKAFDMVLQDAQGHRIDIPQTEKTTQPLGYYRQTMNVDKLTSMPNRLIVNKQSNQMAFGAVYGQYLIPSSEVRASSSGIQLICSYSVRRGNEWQPVNNQTELQKGDLVKLRYEINADRDMDFVMLKEGRPACCEPIKALSGYDWSIGCYREVGDASIQYFFQKMRKGRHVLETEMRIDRTGKYISAVPVVQCVYSPEFSGRAEAIQLNVK